MSELGYRWFRLKCDLAVQPNRFCMWLAWLLPKRLVMWCAYRMAAHATTGEYGHQDALKLGFFEMVKRWGVE